MRVESYLVAEMLQRLEQQLATLRLQGAQLATALGRDQYAAALEASDELYRALDAIVATTEILRDHIVRRDDLGKLGEGLGELVLRARSFVIVTQFDLLQAGLAEPAVEARTRGWFTGQFEGQGIAEVRTHVRARLAEIHATWRPYRQDQPLVPGMTETERTSICRSMIRVAQRALAELFGEPDLAWFLEHGAAATDLAEIHVACKQIVAALNVQIDVELSRPLLRRTRRAAPPSGAMERR